MRQPPAGKPLEGRRVLVTRPHPDCGDLARAVEAAGGTALEMPAVQVSAVPDAHVTQSLRGAPGSADLLVFISANAVRHGARLLQEARIHADRVAAIGEATAAALRARGIPVHVVPTRGFTSESLLAHLDADDTRPPPRSVIIVRGEGGRELLAGTFEARGASVTLVEVYRREAPPAPDAAMRRRLREAPIGLVTATSVEILHNLISMLNDDAQPLRRDSHVVVPSERVATAVANAGFRYPALRSSGAGNAALLETMCSWAAGDSSAAAAPQRSRGENGRKHH